MCARLPLVRLGLSGLSRVVEDDLLVERLIRRAQRRTIDGQKGQLGGDNLALGDILSHDRSWPVSLTELSCPISWQKLASFSVSSPVS